MTKTELCQRRKFMKKPLCIIIIFISVGCNNHLTDTTFNKVYKIESIKEGKYKVWINTNLGSTLYYTKNPNFKVGNKVKIIPCDKN